MPCLQEAALDYLYGYRTKLEKMFKMVAMELPSDPEACQQRIAAAARLILEVCNVGGGVGAAGLLLGC